jgi:SAM-dependent methyltransferase/glycosyltransferase involved in cell wall biosynthesis
MRVLMLSYEIEGAGGSWVRAHSLAKGLSSRGHDVTLWCARDRRSPARSGEPHCVDGVAVVAFDGLAPDRFRHAGLDPLEIVRRLIAAWRLRALARAGGSEAEPRYDVVHGFGHRPSVAWTARALSRWLGIPYVADWANLWGLEGIGGRRGGLSRATLGRADLRWEARVYSRVDGLTTITSDLARRARALGLPEDRVALCGVGADIDAISPGDRRGLVENTGCRVLADESPQSFAGAAAAVLRDPVSAEAMGKRARRAAEQETSWRAIAGQVADFYQRICQSERHQATPSQQAGASGPDDEEARAKAEIESFNGWARRRFSPRRMDLIEEYHEPLVSFGERGRGWRGNNRWFYYQRHHAELRRHRGKRVLNAACGIGELSLFMAHEGLDVVAFDFSPESVAAARELAALHGLSDRIRVDLADVRDLPYADDSFDLVTGEDSLHHLIKWRGSVESIERVLKPGGKVMFCENFAFDPLISLLRPLNWWWQGYVEEHSLGADDLASLRRVFSDVTISDRSFFYTYSRLVAKPTPLNRRVSRALRAIDAALMPRSSWLRSHYSLAVIEMRKSSL